MTGSKLSLPSEAELAKLLEYRHYLLCGHANPDGDAIGSELGLARILRSLGKDVTIWNLDATPLALTRLPGAHDIHVGERPPAPMSEFDVVWPIECPSVERTGLEDHFGGKPLLNLDHHLGNQMYGVVNWVDPSAPSAGEMIFRLAKALKVEVDETTATALYLTLVTDTGGFRYSNATPQAFCAAAELVERGAQPERVASWLYESQPEAALRLLARVLQTLRVESSGAVASVVLTQEMFAQAGATRQDSEGLVDYPRSIAGVRAAVLVRETDAGDCKASLRSRGTLSVEEIARRYGGGGHRNAAGCLLQGDAEEVRNRLASDLEAAVEEAAEAS